MFCFLGLFLGFRTALAGEFVLLEGKDSTPAPSRARTFFNFFRRSLRPSPRAPLAHHPAPSRLGVDTEPRKAAGAADSFASPVIRQRAAAHAAASARPPYHLPRPPERLVGRARRARRRRRRPEHGPQKPSCLPRRPVAETPAKRTPRPLRPALCNLCVSPPPAAPSAARPAPFRLGVNTEPHRAAGAASRAERREANPSTSAFRRLSAFERNEKAWHNAEATARASRHGCFPATGNGR